MPSSYLDHFDDTAEGQWKRHNDEETRELLRKMEEESAKRKKQMLKVLEEGGTPEERVNKVKYIERSIKFN